MEHCPDDGIRYLKFGNSHSPDLPRELGCRTARSCACPYPNRARATFIIGKHENKRALANGLRLFTVTFAGDAFGRDGD